MNSLNIIKAKIGDAEIVADLIAKLVQGFNERSGSNFLTDKEKLTQTTTKLLLRYNFAAFIAYSSKDPVGLITVAEAFSIYNGGDFGVITELYVDENQRSKGVGKLLLQSAFDFSKIMEWNKIEVGAPNEKDWPRTIQFYKNNGFKEKGPKFRIDIV